MLDQDHAAPYTVLQRREHARVIFTLPKVLRSIHRILDSFLFQLLCNTFLLANMIGNETLKVDKFQKIVEEKE